MNGLKDQKQAPQTSREDVNTIVTNGLGEFGGDSSTVASRLNVLGEAILCHSCCILWITPIWGIGGSKAEFVQASQLRKGVSHVCGSYGAFAAVKESNPVLCHP